MHVLALVPVTETHSRTFDGITIVEFVSEGKCPSLSSPNANSCSSGGNLVTPSHPPDGKEFYQALGDGESSFSTNVGTQPG